MILGFKTSIDGNYSFFREKILIHLGMDAIRNFCRISYLKYHNPGGATEAEIQTYVDHFAPQYIKLKKRHAPKKLTIRDDPNNRWQAGRRIHFATGVRTKNYDCFAIGECKAIASIWITLYKNGSYCITIDQDNLSFAKAQQLALDDGFETLAEFLKFHAGMSIDPEHYWDHPTADYPLRTIRKKVIYF